MIFNIQRFSTHDGSGIRTIIFFKGCPLRCPWCSNPESQSFDYDIFFDIRKCITCMECVKVSENGEFERVDESIVICRENIREPLLFKNICPTKAIEVIGQEISIEDLLTEIKKDQIFFANSGGGVTFSGGEPFAQLELMLELEKAIKRLGISTAVETSLDIPWKSIEDSIQFIDEFLIDLKHFDADKLKEITDANLGQIANNLRMLESRNIPITIRISVIPGFNYSMDDIKAMIDFVSTFNNIKEIHFLPYHTFGKGKYQQLGWDYKIEAEPLNKNDLSPLYSMLEARD